MILKDIQDIFHKELDAIYGVNEVDSFFYLLIEYHFDLPKYITALEPDHNIPKEGEDKMFSALAELSDHRPIQYILGETEFYGLTFKLNNKVLIPRPETEELVSWIIDSVSSSISTTLSTGAVQNSFNILDIGTGSGCIAISLAKNLPTAKTHALDVSREALDLAKENALLNATDIQFTEVDILNEKSWNLISEELEFDVIVSNPPYVSVLEKQDMKPNVLDNEPHLALFVEDENPLLFYKTITQFAKRNVRKNGTLYFEINERFGKEICNLLEENGFKDIQLKKDIYGKDRMIKATLI